MKSSRGTTAFAGVASAAIAIACGAIACSEAEPTTDEGGFPSGPPSAPSRDSIPSPTSKGEPPGRTDVAADAGTSEPDDASVPASRDAATADSGPTRVPAEAGSCGTANPNTGFLPSVAVKVGAATRTYALHVPANYDGTIVYPLVIGFHGDGGSGSAYRSSFPIEARAGSAAIFAWPNGTNANDGHSFDQNHNPPGNADVAFFDALVASVQATYCVNPARVYAHGMSGGAYFVNQLGRWRAGAIKAIAPQSGGGPYGIKTSDFDPATGKITVSGPVAALIVHGQADGPVPLSEGMKSLEYWRRANKATSGQTPTTPSPCQRQNGAIRPTVFCSVPGLTHTIWSGAPDAIWQFFAAN